MTYHLRRRFSDRLGGDGADHRAPLYTGHARELDTAVQRGLHFGQGPSAKAPRHDRGPEGDQEMVARQFVPDDLEQLALGPFQSVDHVHGDQVFALVLGADHVVHVERQMNVLDGLL